MFCTQYPPHHRYHHILIIEWWLLISEFIDWLIVFLSEEEGMDLLYNEASLYLYLNHFWLAWGSLISSFAPTVSFKHLVVNVGEVEKEIICCTITFNCYNMFKNNVFTAKQSFISFIYYY